MTRQLADPSAPRMFRDRREAGRVLAGLLSAYADRDDVLVLGLARGGVPVAWEVAAALRAPLDTFIVRKLGVPRHEEFAMGAIASGGSLVLNDDVIRGLRLTPYEIRAVAEREGRELIRRESAYRGRRAPLELAGKTVILVDDGLATGSSMLAAVDAIRAREPKQIVVAVPAAPESTCRQFAGLVEDVVCASMPTPFTAVGASFWDFSQVTDDDVRQLLATPWPHKSRHTISDAADVVARVVIDSPGGVPPTDVLEEIVGDARVVLIGESSHGTQEFYQARADITKWLIEEKGFVGVAAEADWPDAYRVNRYVRGHGSDGSAEEALSGFQRFPAWMWRNHVVADFTRWLRWHNERCMTDGRPQTGFYGLDLYSLHRSMTEVIDYLDDVDPAAAARARERYSCFEHTAGEDGQAYGYAAAFGAGESCEQQVVAQLVELLRGGADYVAADGPHAEDDLFDATRNAVTAHSAEAYYRAMFKGRVTSWNMRDMHMADTLNALMGHLDRAEHVHGRARIVVWAHNSHVGDARATEMGTDGQLTLGQLVRRRYGRESRLIGMSTYQGEVTAASAWGAESERKTVRPGLPGSIEELFHAVGSPAFLVPLNDTDADAADVFNSVRLQRAIGVIYHPQTERHSHYYYVRPAEEFDALIHIDTTTALTPLQVVSVSEPGRRPETYPSGL